MRICMSSAESGAARIHDRGGLRYEEHAGQCTTSLWRGTLSAMAMRARRQRAHVLAGIGATTPQVEQMDVHAAAPEACCSGVSNILPANGDGGDGCIAAMAGNCKGREVGVWIEGCCNRRKGY
jgi:hypothetical protein